jgi:streptolysin S family bacteriocin protoxin
MDIERKMEDNLLDFEVLFEDKVASDPALDACCCCSTSCCCTAATSMTTDEEI